jgi:curved DNA-binding protein CbpA
MKSGGSISVDELRLAPRELRVLAQFDGVRSLERIAQDLPQETESVFRVALLLRELGCIGFADSVHKARPEGPTPPPAPKPAAAPAAGATSGPGGTAGGVSATSVPGAASGRAPDAGAGAAPGAAAGSSAGATAGAPPATAAGTSAGATAGNRPGAPAGTPPGATTRATSAAAGTPGAPGGSPAAGTASGSASGARTVTGAHPAAAPPVVGPGGASSPRPGSSAPVAPPAPARAAAPAAPPVPVDFAAEITALKKRLVELEDQNLFQILGVAENVESGPIKAAYFKLAKQLHPDTVPPGAPPELAKLKAEVFSAVGDAYRKLSDPKARAEYLEELKAGTAGEQVDVARILGAEENFTKGSILVKARKFPEAVKLLDEAIEGNPDEGEFYAWRGYARFFINPDRKAGKAEAMKDLDEAVRRNPRCAPAHYFIGHIAKLTGDNATALEQFKKAVELKPDHIDAQRELRLMGKK